MTDEQLRMQMLSGVITESEYKTKLEELNAAESKDSLNEHYVAGGIVGIGAITQIPSREKTDYEMAFEHFLGERYLTKFENREQDPYKMEEGKEEEDLDEGKEVKVNEYDDFNTESSSVFFSQLANKLKNFLKNEIDLSGIEIDGVEIPEEEHLNDAVEGMMEVLGVVMKGKAYTVGEKEVSPEFLNRFK
jgi:hypothetical protein